MKSLDVYLLLPAAISRFSEAPLGASGRTEATIAPKHIRRRPGSSLEEEDRLLDSDGKMRRIRQETFVDKIYRYRGVVLVVSVPLVLIAIVLLLMPRNSIESGVAETELLSRSNTIGSIPKSQPEKFAVVIDAGSTGSRVHVYKFNSKLELQVVGEDLELFIQIKPGLSKYADEPSKGGDSLRELLDKAREVIPEALQKDTPVLVGATAGLRLLPGTQSEQLLEEVRKMLKDYPFTFKSDSVKILDGADEGSFAWMTVNYLLGKLGKDVPQTVGVVDLGGGSVQLTYAISDEVASKAPDNYVQKLSGMGQAYNVYVHSYLGFGLMAARAEVLDRMGGDEGHPCLALGFDGKYEYGRKVHKAVAQNSGSSFKSCIDVTTDALNLKKECTFEKCSFNGIWNGGGGVGVKEVFVASYFFDRASQLGVISDPSVPSARVTPKHFADAAEKVCSTPLSEMANVYPLVEPKDLGYVCLDITYQYTLMTVGLDIKPEQSVNLVKRIEYKEKQVEAAWPLGAAIASMS